MNPANLTAAERDTILAALEHLKATEGQGSNVGRAHFTMTHYAKVMPQIDALCERLSAPGDERNMTDEEKRVTDSFFLSQFAQPPQAPELVNVELLTTVKHAREAIRQIVSLANINEGTRDILKHVGNKLNDAATKAESALAAQKGQP